MIVTHLLKFAILYFVSRPKLSQFDNFPFYMQERKRDSFQNLWYFYCIRIREKYIVLVGIDPLKFSFRDERLIPTVLPNIEILKKVVSF
ncbi:hypothetical protein LEP1GSC060_3716 [Leptospira weilii serovar Ranarum str. ICFT]|uniref:Uncharacterized protein n=1 Tax=Leptospira weilii serovar Ranarum str. ICFT TaxID=1218598 RepID=N1WG30_9LEPT|nr:hypothetical protein LEP1GSC060_3716 [Leptospira weilii serovar Ranarum str. ICFT]